MKYLGRHFDFTRPVGAQALTPAGGVCWRVFNNPVTIAVGGIAAVILELAQPQVRAGVWNNSIFKTRPLERMIRTGKAAMITVYASEAEAIAMIEGVTRMHSRVSGQLPDGRSYDATDPALLRWVQTTASFGFISAYHHYCFALTPEEFDAGFSESASSANYYGAINTPQNRADWKTLYAAMASQLEPSDILNDFVTVVRKALPVPKPLASLYINAAIAILPDGLQEQLQLTDFELTPRGAKIVSSLARISNRVIPGTPCAQAMKRLGLKQLPKGGGDFPFSCVNA